MNSALSFAKIISRATDDDVAMVVASEEFPDLAAWLDEYRNHPAVARALARLLNVVRRQAH